MIHYHKSSHLIEVVVEQPDMRKIRVISSNNIILQLEIEVVYHIVKVEEINAEDAMKGQILALAIMIVQCKKQLVIKIG